MGKNERYVLKNYVGYGDVKKIALELGISAWSVREILIKNDITIVRTKYTCDHAFFDKDTPESFYFAGLLAADGCITSEKYSKRVKLSLNIHDKHILEKFKNCIGFTGDVREYKYANCNSYSGFKHYACMSIVSSSLCGSLARFNIGHNKTLNYSLPNWMFDHELAGHFLRGLVDGDGTITGNGTFRIGLCGTYGLVKSVSNLLYVQKTIRKPKIIPDKSIYSISYAGENALAVRNFIYHKHNNLCLGRKLNRAFRKNIVTRKHYMKKICGTDLVTGEKLYFDSLHQAERAGFTRNCISACCNGKYKQHKGYAWNFI